MQAHYLAMQGLGKLIETIEMVRESMNEDLRLAGVVLCMFESNTLLSQEVTRSVQDFFLSSAGSDTICDGAVVFEPPIRRNIKLAEAPSHGQSIHAYAPEKPRRQRLPCPDLGAG